MPTITQALAKLKANLPDLLPESRILRIAADLGLRFRQRCLTPVVTASLFLQQSLHGNPAVGELRRLTKVGVTDSAYCQARQRLSVGFCHRLHQAVLAPCRAHADHDRDALWHGHRLFALDGSSFSMPDTAELRQEFGYPPGQAPGCGFPTAHLLVEFDLYHGYLLRAVAAPCRTHDMKHAAVLHQDLRPGDVLLGDRGFCSYAHLALLVQRGLHGVFRLHQRQLVDFRPGRGHVPPGRSANPENLPRSRWVRAQGREDQVVVWFKPKRRPEWMTPAQFAALPDELIVRELQYRVETPGFRTRSVVLATTLRDAGAYPASALAELYLCRWRIEVDLKHLKITMNRDVLRCETVEGVLKELAVFALAYNLVRSVMVESAAAQGVEADRISLVDAVRWLLGGEDASVAALHLNPARPGRFEPRVVKRRPKQYRLMTRPRAVLRKELLARGDAA